ncbi:MAG: PQQ-binding-like beta-propeller repeat protein [Spirochaetes bacterium]|nr:PQQ-binding-like beta-propeller repeat protein [Spirochaetota bacterium]
MKKIFILLSLLFLIPVYHALCQDTGKIQVGIVTMVNAEKDERLDVITKTVTDTVALYLKLIRRYRVFVEEDIDPYEDIETIRRYSLDSEMDNVIYGRAFLGTGGDIVLEMSVYDRYKNRVVLTKRETAEGIFGIFDAADELSVSLVESFSGVHLGFGAITLANRGEKGEFTLFLDGERLGEDILEVDKVINGMHTVEILQHRLLDDELIFHKTVEVRENKEAALEFSIPYLLDSERAYLEEKEGIIAENIENKRARDLVRRNFDELLGRLEDTRFCYGLKKEYDRFSRMRDDWLVRASKWEIEDDFFTIGNPGYIELFRELKEAYEATEREDVRKGIEESANILYNTLGIHAAYKLSKKEWQEAVKLYRAMDGMQNSIPFTQYYNFDQESEYVRNIYREYLSMKNDNPHAAEAYIQKEISNYFQRRMGSVKTLFQRHAANGPAEGSNELLILTDPMGMKVWVDGKYEGFSPIRIDPEGRDRVTIQARDPWFEEKEAVIDTPEGKRLFFIASSWNNEYSVLDMRRSITKVASKKGKDIFELDWKKMENAVSYLVGIDISDDQRQHSVYQRLAMNQNRYVFSDGRKLRSQSTTSRYSFRVLGVNENDIKSPWSDAKGFEGIPVWICKTRGAVSSSPATGRERAVFFGCDDGGLYALDREGRREWIFETNGAVRSSPAVGRFGIVYFGGADRALYALNPNGSLLWKFETGGAVYSSPAVDTDQTVYVTSSDGYLYAVDSGGRLVFKAPVGEGVSSSPVIDADGTVFVGNNDGFLFAFSNDGSLLWKQDLNEPFFSSPSLGPDGTVYLGSKNGKIIAVGRKGIVKWSYETDGRIVSSPVVAVDGAVYVACGGEGSSTDKAGGRLYALSKNGRLKWAFDTPGSLAAAPALGGDDTVYIGDGKGTVFAVDKRGKEKWAYTTAGAVSSSPTIADDGTLLVGTEKYRVYAIATASKGPAGSSWPMFKRNAAHTSTAQVTGDEGKAPYRLITIDGDASDWYGVKPAIDDETSDAQAAFEGTDIEKVRLAADSRRLYAKIDLSDGPPNRDMPGTYRIGLDSPLGESSLSIRYENGWKAELQRWIEHEGKGQYRTFSYGDASEGDSFLEAMVPLAGLGVFLPAYLDVQASYTSSKTALPIDETKKTNLYVPKHEPSDEELRRRWLLSAGIGGYYGEDMSDDPSLRNIDGMFGFGYSFGGTLYWGMTFNTHPKLSSLTVTHFRNFEKPYHFFDIWLIPHTVYTFGYGIGIKHLFVRAKVSFVPEDEESPFNFGIYVGGLF